MLGSGPIRSAALPPLSVPRFSFYEFFAGGGMVRAGLGEAWSCLLANDFDLMKARAYAENWGGEALVCADVARLGPADLPGSADLAWASFPCQDLSLAGDRRGLGGANSATRSGAFWPFWRLVSGLRVEGRAPRLIVLENVVGALTSAGGRDFQALAAALAAGGYRFGALVIDARGFVPQSRPRLFVIALDEAVRPPSALVADRAEAGLAPPVLLAAQAGLAATLQGIWLWWRLPPPPDRPPALGELLEDQAPGARWHTAAETARLLEIMSPLNRLKVQAARTGGRRVMGGVYRRTRPDGAGGKLVRAEVRFDGVAGCLRTPAGGSSRQTLIFVDGWSVRSRRLAPREAARLMGLPDSYRLPARDSDAYHLAGDGVVVPVVAHLARHLLEPLVEAARAQAPPLSIERAVA